MSLINYIFSILALWALVDRAPFLVRFGAM